MKILGSARTNCGGVGNKSRHDFVGQVRRWFFFLLFI